MATSNSQRQRQRQRRRLKRLEEEALFGPNYWQHKGVKAFQSSWTSVPEGIAVQQILRETERTGADHTALTQPLVCGHD